LRNDTDENAYRLVSKSSTADEITTSSSFTGLTIDSPDDVDWYRFRPGVNAPGATLSLSSASDRDGLEIAVFQADGDSVSTTLTPQLSRDSSDTGTSHDTIPTAYALPAIEDLARITGLTFHDATDVDMFKFTLFRDGISGDFIHLLKSEAEDQFEIELLDEAGVVILDDSPTATLVRTISLETLNAGTYYLRARTLAGTGRYQLLFEVPDVQLATTSISNDSNLTQPTALDLGSFANFPDVTGLSISPATTEWFKFQLKRAGEATDRIDLVEGDGCRSGGAVVHAGSGRQQH
jgi:hypothetical protein